MNLSLLLTVLVAQNEVPGTVLGPFTSRDARFVAEVVAVGFETFSGLALLPDGRALTAERPSGRLSIIDPRSGARGLICGMPAVFGDQDAGLIDILVHPEFSANRLLYFSYTIRDGSGSTLVVDRARLAGDSLESRERIFQAQPRGDSAFHYGGRLALLGRHLFITLGDRDERQRAQDPTDLNGKILRLEEDGAVPPDNPLVGRPGVRPEIWSLGHRNPQGLTVRPGTAELWSSEHGPKGGDEVNRILPGRNYGWPLITYGREYDGEEINDGQNRADGLEQPAYHYVPSIAPSGLMYYRGAAFPGWRGNLFQGGMSLGGQLNRLTLTGQAIVREERLLTGRRWRIRAVAEGPDGFIYLGIDRFWLGPDRGLLVRLRPAQ